MSAKPAWYDKHPCVGTTSRGTTCGCGYVECAQYWTMGRGCCAECDHPTNVRLMREDKALMESLSQEFGTDLPEGGMTLTMRRDEPWVLPAAGSVVEIQNTSGETLGYTLITQVDEEGFGGIASAPADDLPAGSS